MKKNKKMHFLDPIYNNTIGTAFLIRDDLSTFTGMEKIQLLLGDLAIIVEGKDVVTLLKIIISIKDGCTCDDCGEKHIPKQIKFDTTYFNLIFKSNETNLVAFEDLLRGTIFELEFNSILDFNNID